MDKKIISGIILLQAVILTFAFVFVCANDTERPHSILKDMAADGAGLQDGGAWYVDEGSGLEGGAVFLHSTDQWLGRGSYTVSVAYESDWNHSLEILGGVFWAWIVQWRWEA